jgi:hypothetical protein
VIAIHGVAEAFGWRVKNQPDAGFGSCLIYCYFIYIICVASKYVPTEPAICGSQCGLAA